MDAHEVSRQLQQQLADVQQTREDERRQLLARLEDQRTTLGNEVKELRDRNAAVRPNTSLSLLVQRHNQYMSSKVPVFHRS